MKEIAKKHIITILCVISIIALFLPFAKVTAEMDIMGYGGSSSKNVSGFEVAKAGYLGFILLIGPIVLIAMNYVKQLEPHKGILAIAVPALCFVVLIIVFFQAKKFGLSALGGNDGAFDIEIKASLGIGFVIAALSYIASIVSGAVIYHNFTLDKAGLEKLKSESANIIQAAQQKVSQVGQSISNVSETAAAVNTENQPALKTTMRRSISVSKTEEILSLIERMAQLKDAGVLTEDEFTEKKKQLLEEI